MNANTDRIEKEIQIAAPVQRVWTAITDHVQFSQWFRVNLESPFRVGQTTAGQITYPGYEHVRMEVITTAIEPTSYFAFRWHPYAVETDVDYSNETPTLVEFRLEPKNAGTRVTVTESGFDALPASRKDEAFRMNDGGWSAQIQNIAQYVETHA
ncbi:SRPBCC family protein [Rubripirellula amarantea]|nr:SRPBCC family protein [Rubripirellula amarantea]MDA8743699.1 SRPBCC family protein [Rubripirellula amarantea]